MLIEYVTPVRNPRSLILLHAFSYDELCALRGLCEELGHGRMLACELHRQPWTQGVDGCAVIFRVGRRTRGAKPGEKKGEWVFERTTEGWLEVAEKLEPSLDASDVGQCLCSEGDPLLVISKDGHW